MFPTEKAFVQNVVTEGIEPAGNFPSGPYPHDHVTYRSDKIVEYETPPQSVGLGTMSRLQMKNNLIDGVDSINPASKVATVKLF